MNNNWESLKEKGNEEFKKKNYNSAINFYTQAIELNSNEETLYGNRSLCYKALGSSKYKLAMYDLNNAIKLNPKNTKYLKRLAQLQVLFGNFGDAEHLLQKCVNLEPHDSSHQTELNNVKKINTKYESLLEYYTKKDWARCLEVIEPIVKECTEFSHLKIIYIETLLNNVKLTEAIDFIINKVSSNERTNEEFDYLLALGFYYDGKYDKAKKVLATVLSKTNDNTKYNHLWKILKEIEKQKEKANEVFKSGKYQEAIEEYTKLLEIDPDNRNFNSTIFANRALCHQKLNNMMEALKDINKAINLNENYIKAYMRRGNVYMALNMYEEAKYDFQKAKDAEPSNRDAIKMLEEAKKKEKIAKKRDYYKILDLKPDANENDIRRAYKKLALKWHPDRNNESEEQKQMAEKTFRDINDAYSVLSDAKKKQQYDSGSDPLNPEDNQGYSDGAGMNFGGQGGGMNFGGFGGGSGGGMGSNMGGIDMEDLLRMFASGGGGGSSFFNMGGGGGQQSGFGGMGGHGGHSHRQQPSGGFGGFSGGQGGGFPGGFPGGFGAQGGQKKTTTQNKKK